jgi:putative ABC transport system substrate-binding protein
MKNPTAFALFFALALLLTFGGAAETWGQANVRRVGIFTMGSVAGDPSRQKWFEPFRGTLAEQGWIEGKNFVFEYPDTHKDPSTLDAVAAQLVALEVDVIWAPGAPMVNAIHNATRTIPIVAQDFTSDPVDAGYIRTYARPGGNVTGVFLDAPEFAGKWFELLRALIPDLTRVLVLWDKSVTPTHLRAVERTAKSLGIRTHVLELSKLEDMNRVLSEPRGRPQAIIILPSPWIYSNSEQLAKLTMKHKLPGTSMARLFADSGGLVAYGPDLASASQRSAALVAKILSGGNPAEIPVEKPSKVSLVVNLKAAKALGITIPDWILLRADEVIR